MTRSEKILSNLLPVLIGWTPADRKLVAQLKISEARERKLKLEVYRYSK